MDRDTRRSPPRNRDAAPASAASNAATRRVLVGRFGAAHGVRGEIRLQSFTENPQAIAKLQPLTDAVGARTFEIAGLRPLRDNLFVARLNGVTDRNGAEALCNTELFVERDRFPQPAPDEFYVADLVGLAVTNLDGETLGVVAGIANYGAGDILEIRPDAGETMLIPFTLASVPVIDIVAGKVVVAPPAEVVVPPDGESEGEDAERGQS